MREEQEQLDFNNTKVIDIDTWLSANSKMQAEGYSMNKSIDVAISPLKELPKGFPAQFAVFWQVPQEVPRQDKTPQSEKSPQADRAPAPGKMLPEPTVEQGKQIKQLIAKLGDDDYDTREKATADLKKIGLPALNQVLAGIDSEDAEIGARSKDVLGSMFAEIKKIGLPALNEMAALKDHTNPEVQRRVNEYLQEMFAKHVDISNGSKPQVAIWFDGHDKPGGKADHYSISKWDDGGKLFWDTLKMTEADAKQRSVEPRLLLDHLKGGTFDKVIKVDQRDLDWNYNKELTNWHKDQAAMGTGKTEPTKAEEADLREKARKETLRSSVYWSQKAIQEQYDALSNMPAHLAKLDSMSFYGSVDKENLKLLQEKVPQLTALKIGYNGGIAVGRGGGVSLDDKSLAFVAGLKNLQSLELYGQDITKDGLQHLKGLKSLQKLDLSYTNFGDKDLGELKQFLAQAKDLKELKLSQPYHWYYDEKENYKYKTDQTIQPTGAPRLTDKSIADLRRTYPALKILGRD